MAEQDRFAGEVLESVGHDRRTFVKRLVAGTAFAIPVVASFDMHSLRMSSASAQIPNGTVGLGLLYVVLDPKRVCDTRAGSGLPFAGQTLGPSGTLTINFPPVVLPAFGATVAAVKINVVATNATGAGYLQAKAAGSSYTPSQFNTSVINFSPGGPVANEITAATNASGNIEIKKSAHAGTVDVLVDWVGFFFID